MKKNNRIAVLIPCFNEALTIEKVINDVKKNLPSAIIYVYDNNSNDDTTKIAKMNGALVYYELKQGKGNVVRRMFRDIDADCYLMVDGDNTYSLDKIKIMCDMILNGEADMVIGDRLSSNYFFENKRLFHNFGNKIVRTIINFLFNSNVHDIMTGLRSFSYSFVKTIPILSHGFEVETEMTIHSLDKNLIIKEIPVKYKERLNSTSKLHTIRDGFKVIKTIIRLFKEYKPFVFFGIISLLFFVISLILLIPVFVEYFNTLLVPRFPSLIFGGFMLIISIFFLICGIILEVVVKKHRQLFEYLYISTRSNYEKKNK